MINWFALLTPLLALPICALFLFVGCSLLFQADDSPNLTFEVNFYVDNSVLIRNQVMDFRVRNSGQPLDSDSTRDVFVLEAGAGDIASHVRHTFPSRKLDPGPATLACSVVDVTDPDNEVTLVGEGAMCSYDFVRYGEYWVIFNAGVSDDGTEPNPDFDDCNPVVL